MNINMKDFYVAEGCWRVRDNGRIELRLPYRDYEGIRREKSFSGANLPECYAKAEEFIYEYKGFLCRPNSTIPQIMEAKIANDLKLNFIKEQTYYFNLYYLRIIRKHPVGMLPITQLTSEMIDSFLKSITHYSASTIDMVFFYLRNAFQIAKDEGLIKKNLMSTSLARKPKSNKPKKKVAALTYEEQVRVIQDLTNRTPNYGAYDCRLQLLIALYSGMRMGEINALTPDDIDFAQNIIHVKNTIIQLGKTAAVGESTKTYAGIRDIPISKKLKPLMIKSLAAMKPNKYNLIFYNHKQDKPIGTKVPTRYFRSLCGRCNIEMRGCNSLRHTFATRCIEAGVPALVLKKWLGHTDIHVTLDTYADVFDRMHDDAVNKLDDYLDSF